MSSATVSRAAAASHPRRLSIGVPAHSPSSSTSSSARAPCSPITNEHVHTATKPPTSRTPVLKKIRSFTSLLARPPSRTTTPAPPPPPVQKKHQAPENDIAAAYGSAFAREVALLQMLDGGSLERNIARVHKARAKAAARAGLPYTAAASGAVRGPNGELFADAQEESERRGLVRGGYTRGHPSSKNKSHAVDDDGYATPEEDAPAWATFQAAPRRAHNDARTQFFADSFAPPVVARR